MQLAGKAERPHDEQLANQDAENQCDCADMLTEAMQPGDHQRNRQHEHVVHIDQDEPAKIVEGVDDQVRQRGRSDHQGRDVDATLTLDHQLVS